jgi:lanosterol synthase
LNSLDRSIDCLCRLQQADGSWEGEVVWCTMILSQYVIVRHAAGRPIDNDLRADILRHYEVTRSREGGWGLHSEGPSQIFTTTLAYVALRILGLGRDDARVKPARLWLRSQPGGALGIPTWGKFWLALLELYDSHGIAALPPELFVLPKWLPFHPTRWYCHTRYIYLAMAYLYGRRFTVDLGRLRDELRAELYETPYAAIDFSVHRSDVSSTDLYTPPSRAFVVLRELVTRLSAQSPRRVRERALRTCFEHILFEQRASRFQGLSPVNGLLNCLAILAEDPTHPDLTPSLDGIEVWQWCDSAEGARYAGARSQVWDTAFAVRALLAGLQSTSGAPSTAVVESLRRAHAYLVNAQMQEDLPDGAREDRQPIRGGWCFSDGGHRWPVSDCTAEALTAILEMERVPDLIPAGRLDNHRVAHALEFLLARQNRDGGFSTYERIRGPAWLDRCNPSEMFRDCMTEHSYVECTASAVEAMATVRLVYPGLFDGRIEPALEPAISFLKRSQLPDGSFPAAWGIHFTYSIFHVVKALRAAGLSSDDSAISRALDWLKENQRADGGWGEHFSTSLTGGYVPHPQPQPVMTSWALLALAEGDPSCEAVQRGQRLLESLQRDDGSWPRGAVNGVFFGTAMLDYRLYHAYFPTWALARIAR